jgi:hypothetical protein
MHSNQAPYRELHDAVTMYDGGDLYSDLVRPWLRRQDGERRWLEAFARRKGSPIPAATMEDLWQLYALSRIGQRMQLDLTAAQYAELMESMGLTRIEAKAFHPFTHEIVTVDTRGSGGPELVEEYWPGYMLGPMLFARAGCLVAAGPDAMVKEIAEQATMYWAFVRRNRPVHDLSHGWGSNSQWRTDFRRDYLLGGIRYYNVDATPERIDDDLDESERLELLRYRSFVKCARRHDDCFPYDYTHSEKA